MSSSSALSSLASSSNTNTAISLSSILASEAGVSTPGIDVTAAVEAAIYADRAPERVWDSDQTTLSSQISDLTAIQTATESLYNDMESLNTLTGPLEARTVTSANSSYVTATAATGTATGVHNVIVNSLATQGSWYSDLETDGTTTLPTSSLTITTVAGKSETIATGAGNTGDTLNDLASAINGDDLGVTATVMTDTTGARLAIVANTSGTAADFSITSQNYTGTSWTSADMPTGSTLGAGSIVVSSGSGSSAASVTVATTAGETYTQLATAINTAVSSYNSTASADAQLNVTAVAGSDANGTNLSLTSNDGSTDFTVNQPSFGFTQSNTATNASITVDGIPNVSASNTVTGAIPGVTLNLLGVTDGVPISLTVAPDASQISTTINQFVTDYNSALSLVNAQFSMTSTTDSSGNVTSSEGVLGTDSTVVSLQSALEQAVGYLYTPSSGTTTVSTLSDLGITVNDDGSLSVDQTTMDNALANDPADVQNFFQGSALNGFANSFYSTLNVYTSPADGAFQVDLSSMNTEYSDLGSQITSFESDYIVSQQSILTAQFSSAEEALQSLPEQMAQLNAELGLTPTNSNS